MGAISPGVLDLYSQVPRRLNAEELADALAFADTATLVLLDSRIDGAEDLAGGWSTDGRYEYLGAYRAEIDQATGMLTAQLGVDAEEAFVRLRAHAYTRGRRLAAVAADVVAHRLTFPPGGHGSDRR
jgi:hypothetical protein